MIKTTTRIAALLMGLALAACGDSSTADPDIVDVAIDDGRFTTLVDLLVATELDDTLRGAGPFTVFAPTDDAFAAFETANPGVLDGLSAQEATDVLLYHVVTGNVPSSAVAGLSSAETVNGQPVVFDTSSGVMVNNATVVIADVPAANGVIHAIDMVLLPPSDDVVGVAVANDFSTLAGLVTDAGLVPTLQGAGPFTVFAPTNQAFTDFETANPGLLGALTQDQVTDILTYHVIGGDDRIFSGDLVDGTSADSLMNGQALDIDLMSGVMVGGGTVSGTDVLATNGVVHIVDDVLVPNDIAQTAIAAGSFTRLVELLTRADLVGAVSFDATDPSAQLTVFAPTDAAFATFEAANPSIDLDTIPVADLANILTYHVVPSRVLSTDLTTTDVEAFNGDDIAVDVSGAAPTVNGIAVATADIRTLNGIIHVINDGVLVPPAP